LITQQTVFVLGAGASMGFGYPSGSQLKQDIINLIRNGNTDKYRSLRQLVSKDEDITNFRDALFKSGRTSVDAFLEHRSDFMQIGKRAIALALLDYEKPELLFAAENKSEKNWYEYLFGRMNSSFADFPNNKISFVTFNYDRSLEHYLFEALKNSYGKPEEEVAAVLKQIPIIHVHGKLGNLPWQGPNCRWYEPTFDVNDVINAANGIRIISESTDVQTNFAPAIQALQQATRVFFLGFGYHSENLARLSLDLSLDINYYGSVFGLATREQQEIKNKFGPRAIFTKEQKILEFLRENVSL
jgi:hypothetical protein